MYDRERFLEEAACYGYANLRFVPCPSQACGAHVECNLSGRQPLSQWRWCTFWNLAHDGVQIARDFQEINALAMLGHSALTLSARKGQQ